MPKASTDQKKIPYTIARKSGRTPNHHIQSQSSQIMLSHRSPITRLLGNDSCLHFPTYLPPPASSSFRRQTLAPLPIHSHCRFSGFPINSDVSIHQPYNTRPPFQLLDPRYLAQFFRISFALASCALCIGILYYTGRPRDNVRGSRGSIYIQQNWSAAQITSARGKFFLCRARPLPG